MPKAPRYGIQIYETKKRDKITGERIWRIAHRPYPSAPRKFFNVKARNKTDALMKAKPLCDSHAEHAKKVEPIPNAVSFEGIENFIRKDLESDEKSKNTIKRYALTCRTFFQDFLPKKYSAITSMAQIDRRVFGDYKDYLSQERHRSGWRAELGILKPVFTRLVRRGLCPKSVFYEELSLSKRPAMVKIPSPNVTKTEMNTLLSAIKAERLDYWGITAFIYKTAWRIEEICRIKRDNIRMLGYKPVSITSEAPDRKQKKAHTLDMVGDDLRSLVKRFKEDGRDTIYLFPNKSNKKHSARHYAEYLGAISIRLLGKKITPNGLRKIAMTFISERTNPESLMAITGHERYETVSEHYSRATDEGIKRGLDATKI